MKEKASGEGGDRETAGGEPGERRTVRGRRGQGNCRRRTRRKKRHPGKAGTGKLPSGEPDAGKDVRER